MEMGLTYGYAVMVAGAHAGSDTYRIVHTGNQGERQRSPESRSASQVQAIGGNHLPQQNQQHSGHLRQRVELAEDAWPEIAEAADGIKQRRNDNDEQIASE